MQQSMPLPGLEPEAASTVMGAKIHAKRQKQQYRQVIAHTLAERILGHGARLEQNTAGLMLHEDQPEEDAGPGEALKSRFAALLMLGARDENHIAGQFDGKEGDIFAGGGALWKTSIRLDPNYLETMAKRTRAKAKEQYNAMRDKLKAVPYEWTAYHKKDRTWSYGDRLATFTMNKIPGSCTLDEVKRFNSAVRHLTRSDYWAEMTQTHVDGTLPAIFGGLKAVEDALSCEGPLVLGHFLFLMRRINQDRLWQEWTKAVHLATRQAMGIKLPQDFEVQKPYLQSVVKRHKPGRSQVDTITREDALDELCKYLTKPADLIWPHTKRDGRRVDPPRASVLLDLCLVARWPRMFEALGRARKAPEPPKAPSLDTSCISVPRNPVPLPKHWEDGAIESEERVDFRLKCANASMLGYSIKKERPPSWRELMQITTLHEWLQIIHKRYLDGVRFRTNWLRSYNPNLDVTTLAGKRIVSCAWPEECILDMPI